MHIAEGILPMPIALGGALIAAVGVARGLRAMDDRSMPRTAMVCAVLFASSTLIHLPLGPSSVHPVLNGLAGLLLGWAAVPAFLISLLLQALVMQYGGITSLGVNTLNLALPAVLAHACFSRALSRSTRGRQAARIGAAASLLALGLSFALWSGSLLLVGRPLRFVIGMAALPHLGLMLAEALFTASAVGFLWRVNPSIFAKPPGTGGQSE